MRDAPLIRAFLDLICLMDAQKNTSIEQSFVCQARPIKRFKPIHCCDQNPRP